MVVQRTPVNPYIGIRWRQATRRGFWLYVWRIKYGGDKEVLYVGRTGDSSSLNAGAPYARMGQHLDPKSRGNSIYTKLQEHKINPQCCKFEMIARGPLLFEPPHKPTRQRQR